jgi:hypothetical protein
MELVQVAQQTAAAALLGTGLVLGLRYRIGGDHIAATTDIASATTTVEAAEAEHAPAVGPPATAAPTPSSVSARPVQVCMSMALVLEQTDGSPRSVDEIDPAAPVHREPGAVR